MPGSDSVFWVWVWAVGAGAVGCGAMIAAGFYDERRRGNDSRNALRARLIAVLAPLWPLALGVLVATTILALPLIGLHTVGRRLARWSVLRRKQPGFRDLRVMR